MNTSEKTQRNKKTFLLLALLSALVSVGIHTYLTLHFYEVKFGLGAGGSVCNINEVLNCDAVTASRFSSFLGLPIALWGACTNLVLAFFLFITRSNLTQDREKTSRYALVMSGIPLLASMVMGTISITAMKHLCLFCITTYAFSIFSFFGALKGSENANISQLKEDIKDLFFTERWVLGFLAAIPVFSFTAHLMYIDSHGLSEMGKIAAEKVSSWQSAPTENFDLTTGLPLQTGKDSPKMTIVEFADFRCPHCKHAAPSLHAFAKSHQDVLFVFKPFPLDGTCNEAIKGGGDGISCGLAFAVMCAEKISKKGWLAHDYFFENQEDIIQVHDLDKNLEALSMVLAIKKEDLKTCVESNEIRDSVINMAKEGAQAKIHGTPSVFVNGRSLGGGQMLPILEAAYESLRP